MFCHEMFSGGEKVGGRAPAKHEGNRAINQRFLDEVNIDFMKQFWRKHVIAQDWSKVKENARPVMRLRIWM